MLARGAGCLRGQAGAGAGAGAAAQASVGTVAREPWVVGPDGLDPAGAVGRWLARQRVVPADVRLFASSGSALPAVARGQGVGPALLHTVRAELRSGSLVRIPVVGTPLEERWHATTLGHDRLPAAAALQRYLTTPEATQALVSGAAGTPATRMRLSVSITLWS